MTEQKKMKEARKAIQDAVIELLRTKKVDQLKVTQICKLAQINRSTFYDNYEDIYDMIDQLRDYVANQYEDDLKRYQDQTFLTMLKRIQANPGIYQLFFRLSLDLNFSKQYNFKKWVQYPTNVNNYEIVFIQAGIRAVLATWIEDNCQTSPEEINQLIIKNLHQLGFKIYEN